MTVRGSAWQCGAVNGWCMAGAWWRMAAYDADRGEGPGGHPGRTARVRRKGGAVRRYYADT
ncbi:hypothetical protein GCM10010448_59980 [Streptomyces glomeratus]|uniref:Uncharacterized protein n=1 Tax=Streptomyces glomeratus TaxID=284452 RepID=A0ABP6M012_9ACTN